MKKRICAFIMTLTLALSLAAAVSAQTVEPVMPDILRDTLAGKTFIARMEGFASDEAMEKATLYFQICEQETYPAGQVESLAAGDTIMVGGDEFVIKSVEKDETGYTLTGEWYTVYLYQNDAGAYYAVSDTEHRFYKNVFGIEVRATDSFVFLDKSDPETQTPKELTLNDLLTRYINEEINSSPDNTVIAFDENGVLSTMTYSFSPWN